MSARVRRLAVPTTILAAVLAAIAAPALYAQGTKHPRREPSYTYCQIAITRFDHSVHTITGPQYRMSGGMDLGIHQTVTTTEDENRVGNHLFVMGTYALRSDPTTKYTTSILVKETGKDFPGIGAVDVDTHFVVSLQTFQRALDLGRQTAALEMGGFSPDDLIVLTKANVNAKLDLDVDSTALAKLNGCSDRRVKYLRMVVDRTGRISVTAVAPPPTLPAGLGWPAP